DGKVDIWELRKGIQADGTLNPIIREEILKASVIYISGPSILYATFGNASTKDLKQQIILGILSGQVPAPYRCFKALEIKSAPILEHFTTNNGQLPPPDPAQPFADYARIVGEKCDLS